MASGSWRVRFLLASDRRSRFRVLFVLLRPSLSLSLCSSLIQPSSIWGLFLVGCGVCLWCLRPSSCASLSFFVRRLFVSLRFLGGWRPVVALSRLRGGVQLFCFPWRPHVRSSGSVWGVGWSSWLSPLPAAWFRFIEFSWLPMILAWCFRYLPCGPYARPLFVPLAVPPYLASCLVGVASPRL